MNTTKIASKIPTGISGLDDLFYGGLRLPNPEGTKGICIAIYGNRGISKQDIAMQIMYEVSRDKHTFCRYFDINRDLDDMKTRYYGLHVGRIIQQIRQPYFDKPAKCEICNHFVLNNVYEKETGHFSIENDDCLWSVEESLKVKCCKKNYNEVSCDLCKLIRHEIVNYNDRTRSLHWTVGDRSDEGNKFAIQIVGKENEFQNVFKCPEIKDKTPIQRYNCIFQAIKDLPNDNLLHSIVIGGFSAIGDDLDCLPYNILMDELRKKAKVSILVFDERGKDLHLNADILIEMRVREDDKTHYIHHELRVAKSDLQRHVYGWHHYKKLRDLSIEVYPNVHALMSHRFASTYALDRLERDSFRFPQTLLQKFQDKVSKMDGNDRESNREKLLSIVSELKNGNSGTHSYNHLTIDHENISVLCKKLKQDDTVLILLFGKNEHWFYNAIEKSSSKECLPNIHCWSVRPSDILPEEILGVIKQYVSHWWNNTTKKSTLHIYIDDFAFFWMYPLLYQEQNFLSALFSICNEVRYDRDFKQEIVEHQIDLHVICSDDENPLFKQIEQLENRNKTL